MMKRISASVLAVCVLFALPAHADLRDKLREYREQKRGGSGQLDTNTVAAGLKEALSIGAKNSVAHVSKLDGYFGNRLIRIAMPENMQKIERLMRKAGFNKEVDRFIVSMNRAAEKAAPQALGFFMDAVKEMTIPDAMQILRGNDTAATQFLKSKTYDKIYGAFKPSVASAMNDVNVTRSFKDLMDKAKKIPFLKPEAVDLDHYVTSKALDGLFVVLGQEERKIRKDPSARVTDLLRKVFQ
jgi:hypothetical protein